MSAILSYLPEGIFWFCTLGACIASFNHLLSPLKAMKEFTPVAIQDQKIHPSALWWGGYAFSAMNVGFATIGLYSGIKGNQFGKAATMLGTGVMFLAFAVAWITRGEITGKQYPTKQVRVLFLGFRRLVSLCVCRASS